MVVLCMHQMLEQFNHNSRQQQQQGKRQIRENVHVLRERESAFSNTRPKNGHLKASVDNRLVLVYR